MVGFHLWSRVAISGPFPVVKGWNLGLWGGVELGAGELNSQTYSDI